MIEVQPGLSPRYTYSADLLDPSPPGIQQSKMVSNEFLFTIFYILVSACFIAPPREFVSAGLTVQNLLSSYLGSEDMDFTGYHLRRTTATVVLHSLLPLGYYIGLGLVSLYNEYDNGLHILDPGRAGLAVTCFLLLCVGVAGCGFSVARYWSWNNWGNHPFCKVLSKHGGPWRAVASSLNIEFRRITKFSSIIGGTRLYITDSWIVKSTTYSVHLAHKPDVHLTIIATEDHDFSHESNMAVQFLNIQVASINPAVKPFIIRLLSTDYGELREKIHAPIRNARNIIIHQSLTDRFLEAFRQQVEQNEKYFIQEIDEVSEYKH
ncbi:hypothetical protein QZH41_012556 [Actinostola sp. cb2023]|nr:hypothetical protein QZH41_012556 [Actinostola sp. cb2023]